MCINTFEIQGDSGMKNVAGQVCVPACVCACSICNPTLTTSSEEKIVELELSQFDQKG